MPGFPGLPELHGGDLETQITCPRCGAAFTCGIAAGEDPCWCLDLPPLAAIQPDSGCYCPACLRQLLEAQQESSSSS
ncbi:MAG: cysteine-rich CWC family protein [Pseudomonadota bacterium]